MGASSQTGTGVGSAMPNVKGPGNNRNTYTSLLTPHVVAAGSKLLSGGTGTVILPVSGVTADYKVFVTDKSAATACNATEAVSSGYMTITFTGGTTDTLNYVVVRTAGIE